MLSMYMNTWREDFPESFFSFAGQTTPPSLLQARQSQLPPFLLIGKVEQSLNHLCCPLLDPFQQGPQTSITLKQGHHTEKTGLTFSPAPLEFSDFQQKGYLTSGCSTDHNIIQPNITSAAFLALQCDMPVDSKMGIQSLSKKLKMKIGVLQLRGRLSFQNLPAAQGSICY